MIAKPVTDEEYNANGGGAYAIPGTLCTGDDIFVSFALYYFINWKYLAETWGISQAVFPRRSQCSSFPAGFRRPLLWLLNATFSHAAAEMGV